MKIEFYGQTCKKYSNIKFNENPSSGSRVVPCQRKGMTKLRVAFRNSATARNKMSIFIAAVLIVTNSSYWRCSNLSATMLQEAPWWYQD